MFEFLYNDFRQPLDSILEGIYEYITVLMFCILEQIPLLYLFVEISHTPAQRRKQRMEWVGRANQPAA